MEEIEKELNVIFAEHKQKYINVFDKSEGLVAKQNNAMNFTPIFESLTDQLISKSNEFLENDNYTKTEVENLIKAKIKEFNPLLISPF